MEFQGQTTVEFQEFQSSRDRLRNSLTILWKRGSHEVIGIFTCLHLPLPLVVDQRSERGRLDLHGLLSQAIEEFAS
jgi:hypothetical protein